MRKLDDIKGVMWVKNMIMDACGGKAGYIELPTGVRAHVVAGWNEDGWEYVSIGLCARRLPTWEEMCYIKDLFWDDEEQMVQIHPKKSEYVDITEVLHLWRPVNSDWRKLNE